MGSPWRPVRRQGVLRTVREVRPPLLELLGLAELEHDLLPARVPCRARPIEAIFLRAGARVGVAADVVVTRDWIDELDALIPLGPNF